MRGDRRVLGGGDLAQQLQRRLVARLERPGREADDVGEQDRDVEPCRDPGPAPRKAPATLAGRPARARERRSAARAGPRRPGGRSAAGPGCPWSTARRRTGRRREGAAGGTWRSPRAGAWNRRDELAAPSLPGLRGGTGCSPSEGRSPLGSRSSLTARNRRPFRDAVRDQRHVGVRWLEPWIGPLVHERARGQMTPLDGGAALGKIGLPAPLSELAARDWDAIVVGGGHNGLTAAAYLARAGRSVLVLERQGADRRSVHARAAVSGPALPDQSLRLRRRAARRSGDPRARARAPRLPGPDGRSQPLVPAARRQLGGALPRSGAHRRPPA